MRTDDTNPYVGLRPFDVDESILFFGRNDQTTELLQRLHRHHFVAVVGSSGSGKSSLLRAGLIPALKAGYLVEDSDHWFIAIMKPGQSPVYNLAEALLQQLNTQVNSATVTALVQQIKEEGADVVINLLKPVRKEKNTNFFLLVDQFEELFRFAMEQNDVAKKDEAIDFVNIMLQLVQQTLIPFYVVITMRTDFIGDCVQFCGLPEAMNKSQYLVPRMNRVQLKTVIEGPAKLYGGKVDPKLTSKLLNELGHIKDELPLLQHALMRMWDFEKNVNKSSVINFEDFNSVGGLEKALSNHADEALNGMSDDELKITKELFQALTAIDTNGRKIRRPVLFRHLKVLTNATEAQLLHIIDLFIKDRRSFLITNNEGDTADNVIDISHESLIRQWNKLSEWVDEEGESASNYLQLVQALALHKKNKRDFLVGTELQFTLDWYKKFKPSSTWANRYKEGFDEAIAYLLQSEKLEKERVAEEAAKEKKEKERFKLFEENQRIEKARRKKQRLLTLGVIASLIIAAGAILLTYYANKQRNKAIEQERIATSASLNALKSTMVANENLKLVYSTIDSLTATIANLETKDSATKNRLESIQENLQKKSDYKPQPVFQKKNENQSEPDKTKSEVALDNKPNPVSKEIKIPGACKPQLGRTMMQDVTIADAVKWSESNPLKVKCEDGNTYILIRFDISIITKKPFQTTDYGTGEQGGIPIKARNAITQAKSGDAVILKNVVCLDANKTEQKLTQSVSFQLK